MRSAILAALAWGAAGLAWATATPTPTVSATPTAAGTPSNLSGTATPSITATSWIIYVTATPVPAMGTASVPNNVFHPGKDQPLQLRYSLPVDEQVTIHIFDRVGRLMWSRQESASAGSHVENWDGSGDSGGTVSSGIYLVDFEGRNLRKAIKVAVIK